MQKKRNLLARIGKGKEGGGSYGPHDSLCRLKTSSYRSHLLRVLLLPVVATLRATGGQSRFQILASEKIEKCNLDFILLVKYLLFKY